VFIIVVICSCIFIRVRPLWGTIFIDIFLEHEVSMLSCFLLLFQFWTVYVKDDGIYCFSFHALRIIKYVALFPGNLIKCRKKWLRAFELSYVNFILPFSSAILQLFCFHEMSVTRCKLLSLNVRGINNFKKRKTILAWCRNQKKSSKGIGIVPLRERIVIAIFNLKYIKLTIVTYPHPKKKPRKRKMSSMTRYNKVNPDRSHYH